MKSKGDFGIDSRIIWISMLSAAIGIACAFIALALMKLIGFFTNLFYYQRFSFDFISPAQNQLGWWAILVPVVGGILVGLMARYGSDRIRGHGIPEALEAILFSKSRMDPKVAVLKPISSAVAIGSGGPFGAEGPIIMTGGAVGSLVAQTLHLTGTERKTLLVAGAAAGMSAIFAAPVAAVLLAVELMLFEWRPRSFIPVGIASALAAFIRPYLFGQGPLFSLPPLAPAGLGLLLPCLLVGLCAGAVATLLTLAVYKAEDTFPHLRIHWMWWPAIGGLIVGLGGMLQPRALGVGYDLIGDFLKGNVAASTALPLILVKGAIWAIALGSGTSGGVLAPILIVGSGLGVLEATIMPGSSTALWPLVSMAAVLGGVMRTPLTGIIFALEITHDVNALLPLLIASVVSYSFTVFALKRSILTEKIARRGFHIFCEYSVDQLELTSVKDVMTKDVICIPSATTLNQLFNDYFASGKQHTGYPVLDKNGELLGMITEDDLIKNAFQKSRKKKVSAADLVKGKPIVLYPEETCREAASKLDSYSLGRLPVVSPEAPDRVIGIISRSDLIRPVGRQHNEEKLREKFIPIGKSKKILTSP